MRRPLLALLPALAAATLCASPAQAAFEPFQLVAGNPELHLQADYAYDPAISSDGSYVAYAGSLASRAGIYRTNLSDSTVETVALGNDTGTPSISETGRYVSFTTNDNPLTGEGEGECANVYVRDMSLSPSEPGAYTLVSARDGSTESLGYAQATPGQPCGSAAAYRMAISGNGQEVAFTVLSASNLTAGPGTAPGQTPTPPDQVAVRFVSEQRTQLVSVARAIPQAGGEPVPTGEPVPGGGALVGAGIHAGQFKNRPTSDSTAAISADGTTVAWMGINVQAQIDLQSAPPTGGYSFGYAEPLWRRIGDGPDSPTRRVLAGDDSTAAGCPPACPGGLDLLWNEGVETTSAQGPIHGSFTAASGFAATGTGTDPLDVITPQLSEDGRLVALLSTQPDFGHDPVYRQGESISPATANAFVVDMTAGLTRAQSITRLTAWASLNFNDAALAGPIADIAISPDGTRVAFVTARTIFPLAPPTLITPSLSQAANDQLYEANLPAGTLELVSEGYDRQPANEGVFDASLSNGGATIALGSAASNLAYGAVGAGSDVFVTREQRFAPGSGRQSIGPPPQAQPTVPAWRISATASPGRNGDLILYVSVPAGGTVSASASAAVLPPSGRAAAPPIHRALSHRPSGQGRSGAPASSSMRVRIYRRRVAHAVAKAEQAQVIRLRLSPMQAFRRLVEQRGGLYATIAIAFKAAGHPELRDELQASFIATPARRSGRKGIRGQR